MNHKYKIRILRDLYLAGLHDPYALMKVSWLTEDEMMDNLSHKESVTYAYKCAESVFHLIDKKKKPKVYNATKHCLNLVLKWINGEKVGKRKFAAAIDASIVACNTSKKRCFIHSYASSAATNAAATAELSELAAGGAGIILAAVSTIAIAARGAARDSSNAITYASSRAHGANNKKHQEKKNLLFLIETFIRI